MKELIHARPLAALKCRAALGSGRKAELANLGEADHSYGRVGAHRNGDVSQAGFAPQTKQANVKIE